MKLSNPTKFTSNNTDGTLIARGEIICQYSTEDIPTTWATEFNSSLIYKWIRLSFDGGATYPFQYKLNNTEINYTFTITANAFTNSR